MALHRGMLLPIARPEYIRASKHDLLANVEQANDDDDDDDEGRAQRSGRAREADMHASNSSPYAEKESREILVQWHAQGVHALTATRAPSSRS